MKKERRGGVQRMERSGSSRCSRRTGKNTDEFNLSVPMIGNRFFSVEILSNYT